MKPPLDMADDPTLDEYVDHAVDVLEETSSAIEQLSMDAFAVAKVNGSGSDYFYAHVERDLWQAEAMLLQIRDLINGVAKDLTANRTAYLDARERQFSVRGRV